MSILLIIVIFFIAFVLKGSKQLTLLPTILPQLPPEVLLLSPFAGWVMPLVVQLLVLMR